MKDQEIMDVYRSFLPFLSTLDGLPCSFLLYDAVHPESSTAYESQGIPAPSKEYAAYLIKEEDSPADHRLPAGILSDVFRIRNEGRLIGLLCIQRDAGILHELDEMLSRLKDQYGLPDDDGAKDKASTLSGWMEERIRETIEESGIPPERMNRVQKLQILRKLQAQGIMDMKGCVPEIAARLDVSVPTVYRYLKKLED